ncbi:hypothetical protein BD309DRAFT_947160 [Dichomitus squalens]|nr:hypothetical protein BD309DRAFT_947160 [Dichomitus squalens]
MMYFILESRCFRKAFFRSLTLRNLLERSYVRFRTPASAPVARIYCTLFSSVALCMHLLPFVGSAAQDHAMWGINTRRRALSTSWPRAATE